MAQRCIYDLLKGRNYLIVRNVSNTIRTSTFNEIRKVISAWNLSGLFRINKSEMTVTCANGRQILFKGLDDSEKIKSVTPEKGALTDIWVEEATECKEEDIKQLEKRLRGISSVKKRLVMSFNPIMQTHWLFKKYFAGFFDSDTVYQDEALFILKTTYKNNRFLEPDDIAALENETDEYWYSVYTLGNWGVLGDIIFTNWEVQDLSGIKDNFDNYRNGLDFGFSVDPTAFVRSHYDRKRKILYIVDEIYEKELTNPEIAQRIRPLIGSEYVTCDSAEPKSIAELRQNGIKALAAKKGKDSINFGIQWLKQQKIIIDRSCQNTINEFQLYQWRKDSGGNVLNAPVNKFCHGIDSIRYACEDEMAGSAKPHVKTGGRRKTGRILKGYR